MDITKYMLVTIKVDKDKPDMCHGTCSFWDGEIDYCNIFERILKDEKRVDSCIKYFGLIGDEDEARNMLSTQERT